MYIRNIIKILRILRESKIEYVQNDGNQKLVPNMGFPKKLQKIAK